jgi:hypothetical protein
MSKVAPDATIDGGLTYIDGSDGLFVCSTEPTTYAQASTDYMLATQVLASSDITIADDANGRSATIGAFTAVPVMNSGTALHIALGTAAGTTLRYITSCTSQALVAGGTVDIPSWKVNIQDPT